MYLIFVSEKAEGYNTVTTRLPSFAYIYTNAFTIALANDIITIRFGISEDPADPTEITEQMGAIMNLAGAKQFAVSLQQLLEKFEAETGRLLLPETKLEEIKASVKHGSAEGPSPTA